MSRIREVVQVTETQLEVVRKNIETLREKVKDQPSLKEILDKLLQQEKELKTNLNRQMHMLHPRSDSEDTEDEVLYTRIYSKTDIEVLKESELGMTVRLDYKRQTARAQFEMTDEKGACLAGHHTLPLFMPAYMSTFHFDDFESIIAATVQVFEAFCRRRNNVRQVEEQYQDLFLGGSIERNNTYSFLEFTVRIQNPDDPDDPAFVKLQITYSLGDVRAENINVKVKGPSVMVKKYSDNITNQSVIFTKTSFLSAFTKLFA